MLVAYVSEPGPSATATFSPRAAAAIVGLPSKTTGVPVGDMAGEDDAIDKRS